MARRSSRGPRGCAAKRERPEPQRSSSGRRGNKRGLAERVYHAMSTSPLRANLPPQWKDVRNHQEERIWQKLREPDLPIRKKDADLWRTGSAKAEALMLYKLLGRNGDSADSLRRLISVTPAEEAELRGWAAISSPAVAVG